MTERENGMAEMQRTADRRKTALRLLIFLCGHVILAAGLTLNTKITLGAPPIISVAYTVSQIWGLNFANMTFCWFGVLILIQMVLLLLRRAEGWRKKMAAVALQFVVNLISTRMIALYGVIIPVFETEYPDSFAGSIPGRCLFLALAILLTGIGASMSLFTRIIPNPGDGVVQGISDFTGISTGTTKNLVDLSCVLLTVLLSLLFTGKIIGVGIGTVCSLLCVGRVVAAFELLFGARIRTLTEPTNR